MQEVTGSIPVISTRKRSTAQKCVVLFVSAKRVRAQFTRESAVHGLQEVSGSIPVISTRMKSTAQKCVVLIYCLLAMQSSL